MLRVVLDFLAVYGFRHAMNVLLVESNTKEWSSDERERTNSRLGLHTVAKDEPLLAALVEKTNQRAPPPAPANVEVVPTYSVTERQSSHLSTSIADNIVNGGQDPPSNPPTLNRGGNGGTEGAAERSEDEYETSLAEEIASESEIGESLAEASQNSQSELNQASRHDAAVSPALGQSGAQESKREAPMNKQQAVHSEDDHLEADDQDAGEEADDFDEELEAARLSSLDAKLKEMEAEDDTGTLQQLKASLKFDSVDDPDQLDLSKKPTKSPSPAKRRASVSEDDGDLDQYGSDFEEDEEIQSEISEVESMLEESEMNSGEGSRSMQASEMADRPPGTQNDRAVDSESALNSYDYIEEVERD